MITRTTGKAGAVLFALIGWGATTAPALATTEAFGLPHTALGNAKLEENPGGGLMISNLGSSGEDGFVVDLNRAAGWRADFDDLRLETPGQAVESRLIGTPMGAPAGILGTTRVEATDFGAEMTVDYSPLGVGQLEVTLYDLAGEVLGGFTIDNGTPIQMIEEQCPPPQVWVCVTTISWICDYQNNQLVNEQVSVTTCDCLSVVPGGGGDPYHNVARIVVSPVAQPIPVSEATQAELRGSNLPFITLDSEAVQLTDKGAFISAIGATTLIPDSPTITLDNIGCFGEDGVAMDLGEVGAWDAEWDALDVNAYPLGSGMDITLYGTVDGVANSPLGTMESIKESDGQVSLYTDFSALGSSTQRIDLFLDGVLQATFEGQSDEQAMRIIGNFNTDAHYSIIGTGEPCTEPGYPCLFAGYTFNQIDNGALALVGGAIYLVDEIRVYPETPQISSVDVLSHVIFYATDIYLIRDVTITMTPLPAVIIPCAGDANTDMTVDPLDAGYVQARFNCEVGTGNAECDRADQNEDGVVDPLDVGYVMARFGPCDCK